jgi:hypothetical protein
MEAEMAEPPCKPWDKMTDEERAAFAADTPNRHRRIMERITASPRVREAMARQIEAAMDKPDLTDDGCCHRTRLRGAPCPLGRACPYDKPVEPPAENGALRRLMAGDLGRLPDMPGG